MSQPLISIIIPSCDRPRQLAGAIKSAIAQTYPRKEIIVVYEKESDLPDLSELTPSVKIDTIINRSSGLGGARNTGINSADGRYLAFLDDDDRWEPNAVDVLINTAQSNRYPIAYAGNRSVDECGDVIAISQPSTSGDLLPELLRSNVVGSPSQVLVKKSAIEKVNGFDPCLVSLEDWDLYIRLAKEHRFGYSKSIVMTRRVHSDSMSYEADKVKQAGEYLFDKHRQLLKQHGLFSHSLAAHHRRLGTLYMNQGDVKTARREFVRSLEWQWSNSSLLLLIICTVGKTTGFNIMRRLKRKVHINISLTMLKYRNLGNRLSNIGPR